MKHAYVPVSIYLLSACIYLDVIIGLGVIMVLMLIITAVATTLLISAVIKWKKGNLKIISCINYRH